MRYTPSLIVLVIVSSLISLTGGGCQSTYDKAYYSTWEKLGWAKRDILVDRVEEARDAQQAAKEEFKTTLEQFQAITGFQGGDLEAKYKKLSGQYQDCKKRADAVGAKIDGVENTAGAMFTEWEPVSGYCGFVDHRAGSVQLPLIGSTQNAGSQLLAKSRRGSSNAPQVKSRPMSLGLASRNDRNAGANRTSR